MAILRTIAFMLYWLISLPFYILNALQRFLSKPWRSCIKINSGDDDRNKKYRTLFEYAKVPLYIVLTPLRLLNAIYYNLIIHCLLETFNYLCEVIAPSSDKEGAGNLTKWLLWLPWRIIKYPLYHGLLTLIESVVWTIVDTFVPALTLYHGTNKTASSKITGKPIPGDKSVGVWMVGAGDSAGNGIYFVPDRVFAGHYSDGSIIVARVSLGRVLDLGLAPKNIYSQCGQLGASEVTKWGLENGYVSGEWWHKDANFWEYCMYDYQNRYNHSWRIRPLYVLDTERHFIQRIPGGMSHWLFRSLVINDIIDSCKSL